MVMWIVLGSLVGVVVIFLIVTSTLDRKKRNKLNIEKDALSKEIRSAGTNVSKDVKKIINANEKAVKNFIPSVGKVKMADINKKAKDGLKKIQQSKDFKLLKHETDKFNKFSNHLGALISAKSNNWSKRNAEDLKFFAEYKEEVVKEVIKESKNPFKSKKAKKGKK